MKFRNSTLSITITSRHCLIVKLRRRHLPKGSHSVISFHQSWVLHKKNISPPRCFTCSKRLMLIKCSCTPLPLHITSPVLGLCVNWFCRSRIPGSKPSTYGPAAVKHKTKRTSHLSTKYIEYHKRKQKSASFYMNFTLANHHPTSSSTPFPGSQAQCQRQKSRTRCRKQAKNCPSSSHLRVRDPPSH